MTPAQQQLIRTSWNAVEPIADDAAGMFYDRLFETDPSVRRLFGYTDMDIQRRALMQMFAVVVRYIDQLDAITPELRALGRRHAGYGVGIDQYASVGRALIGTLEQGLGDAFSHETAIAWADAYRRVSSVMIEAAQQTDSRSMRPMRRRWRTTALPLGWQLHSTPT